MNDVPALAAPKLGERVFSSLMIEPDRKRNGRLSGQIGRTNSLWT